MNAAACARSELSVWALAQAPAPPAGARAEWQTSSIHETVIRPNRAIAAAAGPVASPV